MLVANAIYDVVFKYLMEDRNIAKLLLSGILQTEIIDLELKPQEYSADMDTKTLTVYRIDFKARIMLKEGKQQLVLIELQKAKYPADIMRFRRYLGKQYANKDNIIETEGKRVALPIITIYFLGYSLEGVEDIPIIRVARRYLDHSTGEELHKKTEFIESLTHDSIIVQVEAIKRKRRKTELEKVLSVFEQGQKHEISIYENDYPDKYKPIIRRLLKAVQNENVRETMEVEDEILEELENKERIALQAIQQAEQERQRAEQERKEKESALQREKVANEKAEQERKEKEDALQKIEQEHKQRITLSKKLAKQMLKINIPIEEIIKETGLSKEEIEQLQ